tara:strand:+ start:1376 stop:2053 length:678 start_codon:yes stop_codon:yes gene_type:complete
MTYEELYERCIGDLHKQKSVPQHGKDYYTVATRHNLFMKYFSDRAEINTDIIPELCNDKRVAVKCTINVSGHKYTGMALEEFGSSFINKTSALENAETSALGRALAAFGLHGSEFASADELINAKMNQNTTGTNPTFVGVAKTTNIKKFPKQNGKKNSKLPHVSQSTIDQIKADIESIDDAYALREFRKDYPDLFDLNKISVESYKTISDIYEIRLIQLNQQGVN